MKVMLLNSLDGLHRSSLRGLGQITQQQELEALATFEEASGALLSAAGEGLQRAMSRGVLTEAQSSALRNRYDVLSATIDEHAGKLQDAQTSAQFATWLVRADQINVSVAKFAGEVSAAIGGEVTSRPWRFGVIAAVSTAVLGGAVALYFVFRRKR